MGLGVGRAVGAGKDAQLPQLVCFQVVGELPFLGIALWTHMAPHSGVRNV